MKKVTFRILVQTQISPVHPWKSVKEPIYQMDLRKGLSDRMRWPGPGQQMSCPLGLTTQTSGLVRKQLQRKEQNVTLFQQITRPISFQEPNLLLPTIWVFRRSWVLGPQGLGNSCCRICDSVTVTVCQDSPHCHTVLLCSAPECGASLSCQVEELGESGPTFPTNDNSPPLPTVPKRSPVLNFG